MKNYYFSKYDKDAIKKLNGFIPNIVFDAHMHLSLNSFAPKVGDGRKLNSTYSSYLKDMKPYFFKCKSIYSNIILEPDISYLNESNRQISIEFLKKTLDRYPNTVGEVVVLPKDTEQDIYKLLVHKRIIGFKCYHTLINKKNTWNANIEDYLPESCWKIANNRNMSITLHMVKDNALGDINNLKYIQKMSKKYPNANLILAHAARSFASWTGVENIEKLKNYKNVYFDLSAICESPAIFQILSTIGSNRCMWGSDYSCNMLRGKAISLADTFYWIYEKDLDSFSSKTTIHSWLIGTENLMAIRQACIMAKQSKRDIENIFYRTAYSLFVK